MTSGRREPADTTELYRLERTLVGERLVPVMRPDEATHAGVALLHRITATHAREVAALRDGSDRLTRRLREVEQQLGRAIHQVDQAEMAAAQCRDEAAQAVGAARRLAAKNAEIGAEKRRLRDALIGKQPLPAVSLRIDVDRDDIARKSQVITLETAPHPERAADALGEGRRVAARLSGTLRLIRLDTVAWRAVIQLVVQE